MEESDRRPSKDGVPAKPTSPTVAASESEAFEAKSISDAPEPCTRQDLEEVMSVSMMTVYSDLDRICKMLQHLTSDGNNHGEVHGEDSQKNAKRKYWKAHPFGSISSNHTTKKTGSIESLEDLTSDVNCKPKKHGSTATLSGEMKLDECAVASSTGSPSQATSTMAEQSATSSKAVIEKKGNSVDDALIWKSSAPSSGGGMSKVYDADTSHQSAAGELVRACVSRKRLQEAEHNPKFTTRIGAWAMSGLLKRIDWWEHLEEPLRAGRLCNGVKSNMFECICATTIMSNSIIVALAADWNMRNLGEDPPEFFKILEVYFIIFYLLELLLRLAVHRFYFFVNLEMRWNLFDFGLVCISIVDFLIELFMDTEGGNNMVFMRILRICKLAKILRTFRAMRFFKDLTVMLESFRHSFVALWWSLVMLAFMLYVFALIFIQALADHIVIGQETDESYEQLVKLHFGDMIISMQSLYMAVTGGNDWALYHGIIKKTGIVYDVLFLFFTFFFTFALFNILTGIFVEKAVVAATPDRDDLVLVQRRKARQDALEFRHMCSLLDEKNTGNVAWEDFERHMHNETMVAYMASIGLEVHEVELFFHIVAGAAQKGEVSIDRFVEGCMQMKGVASGIDMQRQLFEMHLMHTDVKAFEKHSKKSLNECVRSIQDVAAQLKGQAAGGTVTRGAVTGTSAGKANGAEKGTPAEAEADGPFPKEDDADGPRSRWKL